MSSGDNHNSGSGDNGAEVTMVEGEVEITGRMVMIKVMAVTVAVMLCTAMMLVVVVVTEVIMKGRGWW